MQGYSVVMGLVMSQNGHVISVFDRFFKKLQFDFNQVPKRIIELGTYHGGFSVFMQLYCRSVGAHFITYDVADNRRHQDLFQDLKIDFRIRNIFESVDEIVQEIQKEGISILLCDNGNKILEFNLFSAYLKPGDFILAHDYFKDPALPEYQNWIDTVWGWMEITESDIAEACHRHSLVEYMPNEFSRAAWVCKCKKEK